jgi:putative ABC transport system permease protein
MRIDIRGVVRGLLRDRAHSVVSIFGLSVGMGFCLLVLAYSRYSWSYDTHVPGVDQVYVIKHKRNWEIDKAWFDQAPMAVREVAKTIPGVVEVSGYTSWFPLIAEVDGRLLELRSLTALPGFTRLIGIESMQGDLEGALSEPDAIALTEAAALRLFGTTNVVGQSLKLRLNAADVTVATVRVNAIMRTPPANTTIPFESLNGLDFTLLPKWAKEAALVGNNGYQGGYLLARLAPDASVKEVTAALQARVDNSPLAAQVPESVKAHAGSEKFAVMKLAPLRDAYMDDDIALNVFSTDVPRGDPQMVAGLTTIGLLLLTLAAINYVNLTVIRVVHRQREISLRKVLGIDRARLALQFLTESVMVSVLATIIGLAAALLVLPSFENLVDRDLSGVITANNLLAAAAIGVIVGVLTAIYPAWVALQVRPARMLAGRGDSESNQGKRTRQAFSVLQLALATGLASVALSIALQARHSITSSPGFDPANKLVLELPIGMSAKWTPEAAAFITEATQHPAIAGIAVANTPVGENHTAWATDLQREGGESVFVETKGVSTNFFELHGIAAAAGRLFQSSDREDPQQFVVLNAEAARLAGFQSPELAVGQSVKIRDMNMAMVDRTVIGIAPAIRFRSLREPTSPLLYLPVSVGSTLTALGRSSQAETEQALHELWPKYFPNAPFEPRPAHDIYAKNYADDARLATLLAAVTLMAMLIAACGVYVLAADTVHRRAREIALRKLYGARRADIGVLMARELAMLLIIAASISLPLSAVVIARYLAPFTEHAPFAYLTLAVALLVAVGVMATAAVRQTLSVTRLRPADALRS